MLIRKNLGLSILLNFHVARDSNQCPYWTTCPTSWATATPKWFRSKRAHFNDHNHKSHKTSAKLNCYKTGLPFNKLFWRKCHPKAKVQPSDTKGWDIVIVPMEINNRFGGLFGLLTESGRHIWRKREPEIEKEKLKYCGVSRARIPAFSCLVDNPTNSSAEANWHLQHVSFFLQYQIVETKAWLTQRLHLGNSWHFTYAP